MQIHLNVMVLPVTHKEKQEVSPDAGIPEDFQFCDSTHEQSSLKNPALVLCKVEQNRTKK